MSQVSKFGRLLEDDRVTVTWAASRSLQLHAKRLLPAFHGGANERSAIFEPLGVLWGSHAGKPRNSCDGGDHLSNDLAP